MASSANYSIVADVVLNLQTIQEQLNQARYSINIDTSSVAGANTALSTTAETTKRAGKATKKLKDRAADVGLTYQQLMLIFNKCVGVLEDMYENVLTLDNSLIEFQKVSDLSGSALDEYTDKLAEAGQSVAKSTSEMVDAATEFRKSGYSDDDAATLALVAEMYTNVADEAISSADAASFIIAQMAAFNIEASNAEHIIDSVNEVSNNFAVSSSDLANNIGNASAALAVGNNTYEQSLAMLTAITEVTRSANKASRGLVTIQNRLNTVLDDNSSTGKKLIAWYEEHNIQLYDQEGHLRSLYEVVGDVASIWDTLDNNQQKYYLQIQGSATQTQNLSALITNYGTALEATDVALNSAGSAAEENSRYMAGLNAQVELLSATFENLSNNVLSKDLLKSLISVAQGGLDFLSTGFGTLVTRATLFGGTALGLVGILGQVVSKIGEVAVAMRRALTAGKAISSGGWALIIGGVVTALTLLVGGIIAVKDAYDDAHPSLETAKKKLNDTQTEIAETTAEVEQYENKLKELSDVGVGNRTAEWATERSEIEANLLISQAYLNILKDIEQAEINQLGTSYQVTGYTSYVPESKKSDFTEEQLATLTDTYATEYEALLAMTQVLYKAGEISDEQLIKLKNKTQEQQIRLMKWWEWWSDTYVEMTFETTEEAFAAMDTLATTTGGLLTQSQREQAEAYLLNYKQLIDLGVATEDQVEAYNRLKAVMEGYGYTFDDVNNTMTDAEGNVLDYTDGLDGLTESAQKATTALRELRGEMDVGEGFDKFVSDYEAFVEAYESGERSGEAIEGGLALVSEGFKAERGYDLDTILADLYDSGGTSIIAGLLWGDKTPEELKSELVDFFTDASEAGYVLFNAETGDLSLTSSLQQMAEAYGMSEEALLSLFDKYQLYSTSVVQLDDDFTTLANTVLTSLGETFNASDGSLENTITLFTAMRDNLDLTSTEMMALYKYMADNEMVVNFDEQTAIDALEQVGLVEDEYANINGLTAESEAALDTVDATTSAQELKETYQECLTGTYTSTAKLNTTAARQAVQNYLQWAKQKLGVDVQATGTSNAPGGLTLVNDGNPVNGSAAELIVDRGQAYIANGGMPTIVDLNPGAKVYNARETSNILSHGVVAMGNGGVVSVTGGHQYSSLGSYNGYSGFSGSTNSTSYGDTFNISTVMLENVNDVESLFTGLKNLALQRSMKR